MFKRIRIHLILIFILLLLLIICLGVLYFCYRKSPKDQVLKNVRVLSIFLEKIRINTFISKAYLHFLFNLILSFFIIIILLLFVRLRLAFIINLFIGLILSSLFEIIQIEASGRVFLFSDILINYLGFLTLPLLSIIKKNTTYKLL